VRPVKTSTLAGVVKVVKILLVLNEFRCGAKGGRSYGVAEVGSQRTLHYLDHCYETEGGREGSERQLYPQMREQWSRSSCFRLKAQGRQREIR